MIVSQTHSWTLARLPCNQALVDSLGSYLDVSGGGSFTNEPNIRCQPTTGSCSGSMFVPINERTYCTDFSNAVQSSSGALIKRITLSRSTNIIVGFVGSAWAPEIKLANGNGASAWNVVTRIDLTKNYPINSSPGKSLMK